MEVRATPAGYGRLGSACAPAAWRWPRATGGLTALSESWSIWQRHIPPGALPEQRRRECSGRSWWRAACQELGPHAIGYKCFRERQEDHELCEQVRPRPYEAGGLAAPPTGDPLPPARDPFIKRRPGHSRVLSHSKMGSVTRSSRRNSRDASNRLAPLAVGLRKMRKKTAGNRLHFPCLRQMCGTLRNRVDCAPKEIARSQSMPKSVGIRNF